MRKKIGVLTAKDVATFGPLTTASGFCTWARRTGVAGGCVCAAVGCEAGSAGLDEDSTGGVGCGSSTVVGVAVGVVSAPVGA